MPSSQPLRLAVFDCDGTLVDSQNGIVASIAAASAVIGVPAPAADRVRRIVGLSLPEGVERLFPEADADDHAELTRRYREAFAGMRRDDAIAEPLYPGIVDLLDRLAGAGYLLGIATGKSMRGLTATLARHGLGDRFVTLQTADHGPGKPHPAMLERAMAACGAAPSETVMIGDTSYDIEMALSAGAYAVGVGWGYHPPNELAAAGAHRMAEDCDTLAAAVEALLGAGPRAV